ncbi:MAG: hypothetical protein ACYS7Y_35260 [Planctomycetota bacterium]|jgi:hypothetical protein
MRGLYAFICFLLIGICAGTSYYAVNTEAQAERWLRRTASYENVRQLNLEILRANEYSELLMSSVRMLANENGILCERDAASMLVVSEYEGENRRLALALDEACDRLQSQQEEIDDLIDENDDLRWRLETLEAELAWLLDVTEEETDDVQSD